MLFFVIFLKKIKVPSKVHVVPLQHTLLSRVKRRSQILDWTSAQEDTLECLPSVFFSCRLGKMRPYLDKIHLGH